MQIRNVFIIMPYGETIATVDGNTRKYEKKDMDDIYSLLRQSVRSYRGTIQVDRMEQRHGNLVAAIIRRLASSDVVIAVLTGRNPNVFYELGVRHSLRLNTIMLVENLDEYPFDLNSYFSQKYSVKHQDDRDALTAFIKTRLKEIETASMPDSPVLDVLDVAEYEQMKVVNALETRKAAIILEGLAREVIGITNVFETSLEFTNKLKKNPKETSRPKQDLSWDVIDGFTKNRPIPGLPAKAYSDAESIYGSWRQMQELWNITIAKKHKSGGLPIALQHIIAHTHRLTIAFYHDLLDVLESIIVKKTAFNLPWRGSIKRAAELIPDGRTLVAVENSVRARAVTLLKAFSDFDRNFSGIPSELLGEYSRKQSTRKEVAASSTFAEIVRSVAGRKRSGKKVRK